MSGNLVDGIQILYIQTPYNPLLSTASRESPRIEWTNRVVHYETHVLFIDAEPKRYREIRHGISIGQLQVSAARYTNRSTHDLDFP